MRIYGFSEYGGPEVAGFLEVPAYELQPGSVLIRPLAAGVNPADIKVRGGARQGAFPVRFPMAMGREAAGVVLASAVPGFSAGDVVFGSTLAGFGTLAEGGVLLDAAQTALVPEGVSPEAAACIPVAAGTAWDGLHELAGVLSPSSPLSDAVPAKKLLVIGAGGGVGTHAIQLGRHLGFEVIGVASSAKKLLVERLGARHHDYTRPLSEVGPVDAVFDLAGGPVLEEAAGLASPGALRSVADPHRAEAFGGSGVSRRRSTEVFSALIALHARGVFSPVISENLPFEESARALATVEAGHAVGKTVVRFS